MVATDRKRGGKVSESEKRYATKDEIDEYFRKFENAAFQLLEFRYSHVDTLTKKGAGCEVFPYPNSIYSAKELFGKQQYSRFKTVARLGSNIRQRIKALLHWVKECYHHKLFDDRLVQENYLFATRVLPPLDLFSDKKIFSVSDSALRRSFSNLGTPDILSCYAFHISTWLEQSVAFIKESRANASITMEELCQEIEANFPIRDSEFSKLRNRIKLEHSCLLRDLPAIKSIVQAEPDSKYPGLAQMWHDAQANSELSKGEKSYRKVAERYRRTLDTKDRTTVEQLKRWLERPENR
jgi:hypothetical protein